MVRIAAATVIAIALAGCGTSDEPATVAAPTPTISGRYITVADAVAMVRSRVEVPVSVPTGLPAGVQALKPTIAHGTAQLTLAVPGDRFRLIIWYERVG